MRWASYVAVGDSFTEGLDDPSPDGHGYRGWADLVAARLAETRRAADPTAQFRYANLAVRGRLFDRIVDEQVPGALRMRPELVSFAGGGNDVLRRSFDPAAMLARFDEVIRVLRASGADVVIFRWADVTGRLPGRRLILPRMQVLNRAVGETAQRHGALLVDLWHDQEFHSPQLWSEDRLHMATGRAPPGRRPRAGRAWRRGGPDLAGPARPGRAPVVDGGPGRGRPMGPPAPRAVAQAAAQGNLQRRRGHG